jgi:hypothetical protein
MLFEDGNLLGWLDFDLIMGGTAVRSLLLRHEHSDFAVHRRGVPADWFDVLRAIFTGYRSMVLLTVAEQTGIFPMLAVIQLLFISYSLRTNRPDAAYLNQPALCWLGRNK